MAREPIRGEFEWVNNFAYVNLADGANIAAKLRNALDTIKTLGTSIPLRIARPADGSVLNFGERVDIVTGDYPGGVEIFVDSGVKVEGTLTDWWITVDGESGGQPNTFMLHGPKSDWEFTGDQDADPGVPGFFRCDDQNEPWVWLDTRGFKNGTGDAEFGGGGLGSGDEDGGDAKAIYLRNIENFSEGAFLAGNHRDCNIALDTIHPNTTGAPAEVSNGSGTPSFRDLSFGQFSASGTDFCIRLRGNHKGLEDGNIHTFPNYDDAVGLVLDGGFDGAFIGGLTADDTGDDWTNNRAVVTGPDYNNSAPPILTLATNGIETTFERDSAAHDVWELWAESDEVGVRALDESAGHRIDSGGNFYTYDGGGDLFHINGNGQIREAGFTFYDVGDPARFNDEILMLNTGDSSTPAIQIGTNGAGFFVNGSGEVVVVDEAGNTTTLS